MSKAIIILGNGFDLDLGLKTSYADFAKSPQWQELMDGNAHSKDSNWLLGYLKGKYEVERWIDIEAALLKYASEKTSANVFAYAEGDASDFVALRQALKAYLKEQQDRFSLQNDTVASALMESFVQLSGQSCLYTFNYTRLNVLAGKCGFSMSRNATHIHGSLADNDDIILGIETDKKIDDRYSFLFKTQSRYYRHTNILKDLNDKDEYVFFGHSLNGMDFAYFNNTFSRLSVNSISTPRLTIITRDEASENRFKNFLRSKYVSLQGLYSNANPVFILTDLVYGKDPAELKKLEALLKRVSGM